MVSQHKKLLWSLQTEITVPTSQITDVSLNFNEVFLQLKNLVSQNKGGHNLIRSPGRSIIKLASYDTLRS